MFEQMTAQIPLWLLIVVCIAGIWDSVWKVIGLWHSARENKIVWFIAFLIFNTVGILPIIYLGFFKDKKKKQEVAKKISKKKKRR